MEPPTTPPVVPHLLGETYGIWCQTAVLAIAAILAFIAIVVSRRVARRQAAINAIFESKRDEELVKSNRHIAKLHQEERNFATFAKKEHIDTDDAKAIRYVLNHYEYVSVGISLGIYDEQIFKRSSYTTVVRLYDRTKPFIEALREIEGIRTIYQDFECLVFRWKQNPLKHRPVVHIPITR
jgi:Domain of unknown function (DUF4760)